jgi:hypothetical protein
MARTDKLRSFKAFSKLVFLLLSGCCLNYMHMPPSLWTVSMVRSLDQKLLAPSITLGGMGGQIASIFRAFSKLVFSCLLVIALLSALLPPY